MRLVIVESPAKAKTINKYLGSDYKVMASYGHIRDLLAKDGSVQPDNNFAMTWEISTRGKKCVQDIVKQLKSCDELLLATDPDREGEAISWHIKEVLQESKKLNIPFKRIAFHEITKNAIKQAIENPRDIDASLVDAYLTRRSLDYLVGFTLSPILWRKLPGSKSAGRVQSVALRMIVEREEEIENFKKQEYWSIEADFIAPNKKVFPAKLMLHQGKKLDKFAIKNAEEAAAIKAELTEDFSVTSVESKTVKRNPSPAFITSTLQQEASRKLGFSTKKTMQLAQNLYEGIDIDGETTALITYMRTDSINLSADAVKRIRDVISEKYGKDFMPDKPRTYTTKVKNAQEAHEAIRPVDAGIIPESLAGRIPNDLLKLYTLIWNRAVASQMSSAEFNQVQVNISDKNKNTFRANGNTLIFEGFLKVYIEGKDEQEEEAGLLPPLKTGDETPAKEIKPLQHFTTPPARFSEASLVKRLEELGIGRPSTYATIIQVLQDREYVTLEKKFFVPSVRGRLVIAFLTSFFLHYLEYGFTADMEQFLDDISNGTREKTGVLQDFWNGFKGAVDSIGSITITEVINKLNSALEHFLFTNENGEISRKCPECKEGELSLKIGRFGSFVGCSRYPDCKYVRRLDSTLREGATVPDEASEYPKTLGVDPVDNAEIWLKKGPYGLYVEKQVKHPPEEKKETPEEPKAEGKTKKSKTKEKKVTPPRVSVPKFIEPGNMSLDIALFLLSLPKVIGTHEGEEVKVGIGRFGPYVLYKGKFVSIPKSDNIMDVNLARAVEIISKGKKSK